MELKINQPTTRLTANRVSADQSYELQSPALLLSYGAFDKAEKKENSEKKNQFAIAILEFLCMCVDETSQALYLVDK